MDAANRELDRLARIDTLTGLANRRFFDETLQREFKRAQRDRKSLALLMMDVDFFKAYNDTHGHAAGDKCLAAVAQAIQATFRRPGDFTARYGGEEFAAILPSTDANVVLAAKRCLENVRNLCIAHGASTAGDVVTLSIGISVVTPDPNAATTPETLIALADKALYGAKVAGKNRVSVYGEA